MIDLSKFDSLINLVSYFDTEAKYLIWAMILGVCGIISSLAGILIGLSSDWEIAIPSLGVTILFVGVIFWRCLWSIYVTL